MSAIVQNDVKLPFHTENIQKKKKKNLSAGIESHQSRMVCEVFIW